jgi:signal transduction histidine kinase
VNEGPRNQEAYENWLVSEVLLLCLLGASLALFVSNPALRTVYDLNEARLVLDTAVSLAAFAVAVLAGIRFSVEGRRLDLLLCGGFSVFAASTLAFEIVPQFSAETLGRAEAWAGVASRLVAGLLIAAAPFDRGRIAERQRVALPMLTTLAMIVTLMWALCRSLGDTLPSLTLQPLPLTIALALQATFSVLALVGFGLRYRNQGKDLDRWLALAATLMLFAELSYVFTPIISPEVVSQGDFLRLLSYGVLLLGVWRAIRYAEFGRAVAEERARVAREIHDGLAQYLFAISTHANLLASGMGTDSTVAQIREAAAAAQQEARYAILALSSASGNAPFDSALHRYVEFLTADGALDVELEVDDDISLAPDEQIEIFRIVQEGLANVRKHAQATRATVTIGTRGFERFVQVVDNGEGFDGEGKPAGQGLKNMRSRAVTIGGGFTLSSTPGRGTQLEVVLRA